MKSQNNKINFNFGKPFEDKKILIFAPEITGVAQLVEHNPPNAADKGAGSLNI